MEQQIKRMVYKEWWFWLIIILLLAIIISLNTTNNLSSNNEGKDKQSISVSNKETQESQLTETEIKKNISIEKIGITRYGDFVYKIINKNNINVHIDTVSTIFKDENNVFVLKESSDSSFFIVKANSEVIMYNDGYDENFNKYPNYEFSFELTGSWVSSEQTINNIDIKANNTKKQISVELLNNNNFALSNIKILVAYYKEDKIIGVTEGYEYDNKIDSGQKAYINVSYAHNKNYDDITDFDKYEVYLLSADIAEY